MITKTDWKFKSNGESHVKRPIDFEVYTESDEGGKTIAEVSNLPGYNESAHNAQLIAHAPDLLSGFEFLLERLTYEHENADADYLREFVKSVCVNHIKRADGNRLFPEEKD